MEKHTDYAKIEKQARIRSRVRSTAVHILLSLWAVIVLFPFYWMVLTSVKSYSAYSSERIPAFFTLSPTLQNYRDAFTAVPLGRYFLNTVIFTVATTAIMLVVITYDVNTETAAGRKRLRQIARQCVNYGQRVQNSVFECLIDAAQCRMLQQKLCTIMDDELDSLRFYYLGNKYENKIEHFGAKRGYEPEGVLMV